MAKKILSIEVGVWWTKVCVVDYRKSLPHVYQAFYFATPEYSVEDGYIRDKESFAISLKGELAKRRIVEKNVMFSINSSKVVTREVMIPVVKDKEIAGVIGAQIREYFPMDVSDYTISHKKMGEVDTPKGKQIKVMLVAVPDNLLSNYTSFAKENGFSIENFEYIGNSAVSIVNSHFQDQAVIVQLEEQATIISMVAGKHLLFQRIAPYGYGTSMSSVLEHPVLGIEDDRAAFDFLCEHDVLHEEPKTADFSDSDITDTEQRKELLQEAYEDIRETLTYHIRVVSTALDYYKNQTQADFQGKLYLVGDGARFAGIDRLFEAEIPLDLTQLNYESMMHFSSHDVEDSVKAIGMAGFLSVVGAAVAPLEIVSKEIRERESKKSNLKFGYIIFAASAFISVILIVCSSVRYFTAAATHKLLAKQISDLQYIEEIYQVNKETQQKAVGYFAFDAGTKTPNEAMDDLVVYLEQELPLAVVVQNITITEGTVTINMMSDTKLTAAQMLMNFQSIPYLTNIEIPSMTETESASGGSVWQYTVMASYIMPSLSSDLTEQANLILGISTETASEESTDSEEVPSTETAVENTTETVEALTE